MYLGALAVVLVPARTLKKNGVISAMDDCGEVRAIYYIARPPLAWYGVHRFTLSYTARRTG